MLAFTFFLLEFLKIVTIPWSFEPSLEHSGGCFPDSQMQRFLFQFDQIRKKLSVFSRILLPIVKIDDRFNKDRRVGFSDNISKFVFGRSVFHLLNVIGIPQHDSFSGNCVRLVLLPIIMFSIEYFINFHKLKRILICQPTNHAPLQLIISTYFIPKVDIFYASVDFEGQSWKILFQTVYSIVHKRRNISVLGWVQAFQESFSGVDYEMCDGSFTSIGYHFYKLFGKFVAVELINSQSTFDRAFYFYHLLHCFHTLFHQFRFLHEAGTERSLLHSWGRTPHIQIDTVVAVFLPQYRSFSQFGGIRTA